MRRQRRRALHRLWTLNGTADRLATAVTAEGSYVGKPSCFCGCGKEVGRWPPFIRSANNLGHDVTHRLAYTREMVGERIVDPPLAHWDQMGDVHLGLLRNAIHYHDPLMESDLEQWLRTGRELEQGLVAMGALPKQVWLTVPDEVRRSHDYAERLGDLRRLVARSFDIPAGATESKYSSDEALGEREV